jgi:hypothetical protein
VPLVSMRCTTPATTRQRVPDVQRVNVDFPVDLLRAIDREAKRIGVSRQALTLAVAELASRKFSTSKLLLALIDLP